MKSRTLLRLLIVLAFIALGGIWYFSTLRQEQSFKTFPATVNRDCAPWDGAAFTLTIQYDPTTVVYISKWRSPDIKFPTTFSFPDETRQVGIAYILPELDPLDELTGIVWFERVQEGTPLEGRFKLTSVRGETYEGKFTAEWGNQIVYCG
ncbi:MAG TPA: hypothetical protein VMJ90_03565 [Anaerolineales bacterium]|nr:hypothetical protein [Anaerolineales bacterium]